MADLPSWRQQLDEIDESLVRLLAERFAVTSKIGEHKAAAGLAVRDRSREAQQLERIKKLAREQGVDPSLAGRILQAIIDQSAEQQAEGRKTNS